MKIGTSISITNKSIKTGQRIHVRSGAATGNVTEENVLDFEYFRTNDNVVLKTSANENFVVSES